jgi:hypothetical protein
MQVYLRINKHYVATVRSLSDLESYLKNVNDTDETFGEITEIREANDVFVSRVYRMIKRYKVSMNQKLVGLNVSVHRNQGLRDGKVIAVTHDKFLIRYSMPSGSVYYNVLSDISKPDRYKSITLKRATHSDAFGDQLTQIR